MILFRFLSFIGRIIASFVFVFILQIQLDGKTLESYLNDFGQRFFMTKVLKTVSQDLVKLSRRGLSSSDKQEEKGPASVKKKRGSTDRQISSSKPAQQLKGFMSRVTFPSTESSKEESVNSSSAPDD